MKYQVGTTGRTIVARFEDGEDVIGGITDIAKKESIKAAVIHLVGGLRAGRFVVGPESEEMPPRPMWKELNESHEVLATGTLFWDEEAPRVHIHGAYAKGEKVSAGCLRENSGTFLVLEAVIMELVGIDAKRELDPASGMKLLKI